MNDTDDAFLLYAVGKMPAAKRAKYISIRDASEPQWFIRNFRRLLKRARSSTFLKNMAGTVYGIYQYCTTLNSAFATWGVIAGLA
jgi:hypothetical protein